MRSITLTALSCIYLLDEDIVIVHIFGNVYSYVKTDILAFNVYKKHAKVNTEHPIDYAYEYKMGLQ